MSEPRDAEPMEESTTRPSLPSSSLPYHSHRIGWLNGLVSILVVAGMSGVALALFSHLTALPARVMEAPGMRMVQAGGLTFVMRFTPGPYQRNRLSGPAFRHGGESRGAVRRQTYPAA
jgi:hypothetical protein